MGSPRKTIAVNSLINLLFWQAVHDCPVLFPLPNLCHLLIRNEKNQLLLGIRRANRPQTVMPSSVLSSESMHIGLLAAAAHAAATNSRFTIFYNPRLVSSSAALK